VLKTTVQNLLGSGLHAMAFWFNVDGRLAVTGGVLLLEKNDGAV